MKKLLLLLISIFIIKVTFISAQVPNPGFEHFNYDGTVSNWGSLFLFAVIIDSNGVSQPQDSIVFDNQFYFPTPDAHSGSTAMEMRNAYNYTQNVGYAGHIISTMDSVFMGFSTFTYDSTHTQPVDLSFYYKYFPVNGDSGMSQLQVFDSLGYQIGEATIIVYGTVSNYTLATTPVVYSSPGVASYFSLNFSTFYTDLPGFSQPGFGTRFIVDDVSINSINGIKNLINKNSINIYPNPVKDKIFIDASKLKSDYTISILNLPGQTVYKSKNENQIDVSFLPMGIYYVNIHSEKEVINQKFIKE